MLNGKPGVAAETRRAVLGALDLLGYERPDKLGARSAGLVGLVVPELSNPVFPAFAQAVESMLATDGYTPLLCTQSPGGTTEDAYVEMLLEHGVDGIVFVSGLHADTHADPSRYQRLRERGLPFVLLNGHNPAIDAPSFSTDDRRQHGPRRAPPGLARATAPSAWPSDRTGSCRPSASATASARPWPPTSTSPTPPS